MTYVLDTNVVSELRKVKAGRADPGVVEWAEGVDTGLAFVSAITIQELEHGVLLAERRDPRSGQVLRRWLDNDVYNAFSDRVLPIDTEVARTAASLHVPDPAPMQDALIAATAIVSDMTVVTRNATDFQRYRDIRLINPWSEARSR